MVVCCPQIRKGFALKEILHLKEQNPLSYSQGKNHLKSLIFQLPWLQSSRATWLLNQIPKLVQENHLPHSFLQTDAIKSLAKITACSCCFMHTEAHTFTSFSYRGSLFPPCPWCSWLLRYCRICITWGGEGRALEIQLFHNLWPSAVSFCELWQYHIMFDTPSKLRNFCVQ